MSSELSTNASSKKRRIMIITADESIIEQIQNSNNPSLIRSIIIGSKETGNDNADLSYSLVSKAAFRLSRPRVCFLDAMQVTDDGKLANQKKTRHNSLTCVVCGSPALGYNFDAITCESCKAFFRRNALKTSVSFRTCPSLDKASFGAS